MTDNDMISLEDFYDRSRDRGILISNDWIQEFQPGSEDAAVSFLSFIWQHRQVDFCGFIKAVA
jgi:hypothetical protein